MALDYRPEIRSLLRRLKKAGFALVSVNNGEETINIEGETMAVDHIVSVEEAWLNVRIQDKTLTLFLVLGNDPGEIVCDYHCHDLLEKVTTEHYERWESRKQPVTAE